jgi:hypothetical protein
MLNPIAWVKVNVEAFKFTYKRGMELMKQHPFEDTRVLNNRVVLEWCDHLEKTGRSHLIKKPEVIAQMREALKAQAHSGFAHLARSKYAR